MGDTTLKLFKENGIRVRFAPSPTGLLHIGVARTALFNFLFAKKNQGVFILRIDDTDKERSQPEWENDILENLKWLGMEWDEIYKQSERVKIYEKYLKKLLKENKAYYCFCSEEELEAQKQYQMSLGQPPHYSGKCAKLSEKEIKNNLKEKKDFVVRFKVPSKIVKFNDRIRGEIEFNTELFDDFIIAKDFKTPLYNFAGAIDDFEMKISHIIRGEDHISNTPKQILIQEALGFPMLQYAHLPLILGPDRSKLSKRHGAVSLSEYREIGYLPETLVNFLAFLGWNPGDEREVFSMPSLIKEFSFERCQKGGAVFNSKRLDWLNGFYLRHKTPEKLTELCLPYLIKNNLIKPVGKEIMAPKYVILENKEEITFNCLIKIIKIYQERIKYLSEIAELSDFFFREKLNYDKELLRWKNMTNEEIFASLDASIKILSEIKEGDWNKEFLEKILFIEAEKFGLPASAFAKATVGKEALPTGEAKEGNRGYLLWPLRVALTGKKASAGPFEIAEILGKQKTLNRLEDAKAIVPKS